ncbi:MAG: ABC transporter substrate-binding protein [Terriglobia bacterium]
MTSFGSKSQGRRTFLKAAPFLTGGVLSAAALLWITKPPTNPGFHHFSFAASFKGDLYYPAIIADQQGFYRDEKQAIDINYGFGGGDSLRLVAAGRLPLNCAEAGESVVLADGKGANVSLICTYMTGESNCLVAQPGIRSYKNLPNGEILLGVSNPFASSTVSALIMLRRAGVSRQRITPVSVGSSSGRYAAVLARKVHVAAVELAFAVRAPLDGLNVLGRAADVLYPTVFISHSVNNDWANRNKENFDLAVRNTTATLRGLHWGFANKEKMIAWLEDVAQVPARVAPEYYEIAFESRRPVFSSDGKLRPLAWKNTFEELDFAQETKPPFPKPSDLQRDDIYDAAVNRLREVYRVELTPSKAEEA